jgi:hypothetical protein
VAELPVEVKIIEAGYDRSRWQPALADATDTGYDVVIVGTFDMTGFVVELAPEYPDVKFIVFDDTPDFSTVLTARTYWRCSIRRRRRVTSPATPLPNSPSRDIGHHYRHGIPHRDRLQGRLR